MWSKEASYEDLKSASINDIFVKVTVGDLKHAMWQNTVEGMVPFGLVGRKMLKPFKHDILLGTRNLNGSDQGDAI